MRQRRSGNSVDERDRAIEAACERLMGGGVVAPLLLGGAEERAWADCDLASLAESHLGEPLDPRGLDEARRADWSVRACSEPPPLPAARSYERCLWLVDAGERVGTAALASSTHGGTLVRLASLYVFPERRRRGVGRRALAAIRDALGAHQLGLRLDTCWTWQRTVRFYLDLGLWARMWKRDLDLWWQSSAPSPIVEVGDAEARLSVDVDGARVVLVRARRQGDRLVTFEDSLRARSSAGDGSRRDERIEAVAWDAASTLAVHLAVHGWPLLANPDTWELGWHGDGGSPEGLAYRIVCWEAWSRAHGWRVETPRIPGLPYPTWEELEARWATAIAAHRLGEDA